MRFLGISTVTAVSALLAAPGLADSVEYDLVAPENFTNTETSPEEVAAIATDETGSRGNGSWQADPSIDGDEQHLVYMQAKGYGTESPDQGGQQSYAANNTNPNLLYSTDDTVTYNDLISISFDTNSDEADDWFVNLTTDFMGNQGSQFDAAKGNLDESPAANGFTTYTFSDAGGTVYSDAEFQDIDRQGPVTQYTLSDLQQQYGDNEINLVSLATNSDNMDFAGNVDNFTFTYRDGNDMEQTTIVDLEAPGGTTAAIPVPAALPLLAGGIGVLAGVGRLRRKG